MSITNELFREFQSDGCFDVAKELWKSKNLMEHFQIKNHKITSSFLKEVNE